MKGKGIWIILIILIIILLVWYLQKDGNGPVSQEPTFAGWVLDNESDPVVGADVTVSSISTETDENGYFKIEVDSIDRYIVNARAFGYGMFSGFFDSIQDSLIITLSKATVVEANADEEIFVTDMDPQYSDLPSAGDDVEATSIKDLPFVFDSQGNLIDFGYSPEMKNAYETVSKYTPPRRGSSVRIGANRLRRSNGQSASGQVKVAVSSVNIYSNEAMPGNYTAQFDRRSGYMVTYGAVNIEVEQDGELLGLEGTADVIIPVDTLSLLSGEKLQDTIPFLTYSPEKAVWTQMGYGILNDSRTAYEGKTSHFSVFNMDMEKTTPSCVKLCTNFALPAASLYAQVEVTVPNNGSPKTKTFDLNPNVACPGDGGCTGFGAKAFGSINIPPCSEVGFKVLQPALLSTYVIITGPAVADPVGDQVCDFNNCSEPIFLRDLETFLDAGTGFSTQPIIAVRKLSVAAQIHTLKISWVNIYDTGAAPPDFSILVDNDSAFGSPEILTPAVPMTDWIMSQNVDLNGDLYNIKVNVGGVDSDVFILDLFAVSPCM